MDVVFIVAEVLIVVSLILLWFVITYNGYQYYIIRINEVETNIDSMLRKKFDLVSKGIEIVHSVTNDDCMSDILDLKNQKVSNFDLDRKLIESFIKFESFKDKYEDLENNESFIKVLISLNDCEIELEALRAYYNDIITKYNKKIKQFPSDVVAKISHFKVKPYFDGKDMFDNKIDDFKL